MDDALKRLFGPNGMGLCIKDLDRKVLFQNEACRSFCGDMTDKACGKGCMEYYTTNELCPSRSEGAHVYPNKPAKDQLVDMIVVNNSAEIVTMLYPVSKKHEKEMEFFTDKGLSRRELEIVGMVVRGMTNSEIVKKLAISKATLKTHLNNVYKKLPPESRQGFRRRALI